MARLLGSAASSNDVSFLWVQLCLALPVITANPKHNWKIALHIRHYVLNTNTTCLFPCKLCITVPPQLIPPWLNTAYLTKLYQLRRLNTCNIAWNTDINGDEGGSGVIALALSRHRRDWGRPSPWPATPLKIWSWLKPVWNGTDGQKANAYFLFLYYKVQFYKYPLSRKPVPNTAGCFSGVLCVLHGQPILWSLMQQL